VANKPNIYKKINPDSIKIWLPDVQQRTHFSCGAAVVHSICSYYGLGLPSHYDYFTHLETDEEYGTPPHKISNYLNQIGISAKVQSDMSVKDVCQNVQKGKPVILVLQAYGNPKAYKTDASGHYVVAIGYDKKNIIFEDPWLNCVRGYISKTELLTRWHDCDYNNNHYIKTGIICYKRSKSFYLNYAKKII